VDEATKMGGAGGGERAGAHVFFGMAGLKIHGKLLLIVRREGRRDGRGDGRGEGPVLRRYVHAATGNYNAATARLYTDLALVTADDAIGEDACDVFNMLSGFSRQTAFRKLVVAPLALRRTVVAKIDEQADRARAGGEGRGVAQTHPALDP